MRIIRVPIDQAVLWEKNPRGIKKADFERLKKQIKELGEYKPLVGVEKDGKFVILGGNMRLRAYRELGVKEVDISVVDAKTESAEIRYALSDNDRAGYYDEDQLAELLYPHLGEITLDDFKVDLGQPLKLADLMEQVGPDRGPPRGSRGPTGPRGRNEG